VVEERRFIVKFGGAFFDAPPPLGMSEEPSVRLARSMVSMMGSSIISPGFGGRVKGDFRPGGASFASMEAKSLGSVILVGDMVG